MKKIRMILAAVSLLCCFALLAGCGEQKPGETTAPVGNETEASYQVTVKDALGNAYPGVIVRFMRGGEQIAMQVTDANGVAAKVMDKGEYTVELAFTNNDRSYHYGNGDMTLTPEKTAMELSLAYALGEDASDLAVGADQKQAYRVSTGCTYVTVSAEGRSYYLFTPTEAGTYEFGVIGNGAAVGYYGAPHFVQSQSAAEVVDNKFTISVSSDMIGTGNTGTSVLVIGVDAVEADTTGCILTIQRIGDAAFSPANEPWVVYQPTVTVSPYTVPAGAKIQEFDLSAATGSYNLVFNQADGYYHLNSADGPLVLMRLTQPSAYLEAIATILREYSGMGKYFYDDNGEFLKKENYTDCLLTYSDNADETYGVYPLTEDLKYMIQQRGEYVGWWDQDSHGFLFQDDAGIPLPGINPEHAWLFLCCYIEG